MDFLLDILGGDVFAAIISFLVAGTLVMAWTALKIYRNHVETIQAQLALKKIAKDNAKCPSCHRDLTKEFKSKSESLLWAGYGIRKIVCKCLAVSKWDILGLPVCVDWRPPTPEEIALYNEKTQRDSRRERIRELTELVARAKAKKTRRT